MEATFIFSMMMLTSTLVSAGTGDSGGGNTYRGRPLESYIVNPRGFKAYESVAREREQVLVAGRHMREIFNYALGKKTWYLVPGPLQRLPDAAIGSAVSSEQAALQDFDSVWIDQDLFFSMSESDQARLMLHEVFMALRLLRYQSFGKCVIDSTPTICIDRPARHSGKPSDLTARDYADIRRMTELSMALRKDVSFREVADLLHRHGFSSNSLSFEYRLYERGISRGDFLEVVDASFHQRFWPSYRYEESELFVQHPHLRHATSLESPILWKPSVCAWSRFKATPSGFRTTVSWRGHDGGTGSLDLTLQPRTSGQMINVFEETVDGETYDRVGFATENLSALSVTPGEVGYGVTVVLLNEQVFEISLTQMIAAPIRHGVSWRSSDFQFDCSTKSERLLKPW